MSSRLRPVRWSGAVILAACLLAALFASDIGRVFDADARSRDHIGGRATRHEHVRGSRPLSSLVPVTVSPKGSMAVPRSFLGLSMEYWTLPLFERDPAALERVLGLLRTSGDGPLVLRIGGDSADHSFWEARWRPLASWAFGVTPHWLQAVASVVRADHLRVILDFNLLTAGPLEAASLARAALATLPRHAIVGFEVGNEDDIYRRRAWLPWFRRDPLIAAFLPSRFDIGQYLRDFTAVGRALHRVAPHVPLVGPAVAAPVRDRAWVATLIARKRRALSAVSAHEYLFSACQQRRRAADFPTINRLLSPRATTGLADHLGGVIALAHDAGLPFRLTEFNSVTCGGRPGVSNTFVTALWAPQAILTLLRAGADGVDIHTRANTINAPFTIRSGGLFARPLLYGLILVARALGPHGRLLHAVVSGPQAGELGAWALRVAAPRPTLHVVLVNRGARALTATLRLPARGRATVQRLLAPRLGARGGVTLGGRWLTTAGTWTGRAHTLIIGRRAGRYVLAMPADSAALLSVRTR